MATPPSDPDLLQIAAEIVCAHVSHNTVPAAALPGVIQSVYDTLSGLGTDVVLVEKPQPAVPVGKSVFPDHIVCLEDGKKLKMLKRHLQTAYGITPDQYRERWGLPRDYPMIASKYAARRSELAKSAGLGTKSAPPAASPTDVAAVPPVQKVPAGVRGQSVTRRKRSV
jgi:predicted transcriptional regulator